MTHFLVGILIYKIFEIYIGYSNTLLGILLYFLIILSHIIVDTFGYITYHVPDPRPKDKFWVSFHILTFILTLFVAVLFIKLYFWPMFFSVLIDIIDWLILRAILKKKPVFHPLIDKFRNKFFFWLPNWIEKKWAVINEFIILLFLGLGVYYLN